MTKKKEKAIKFVKFLSCKESSTKFIKSGLIVPARKDTTELFLKEFKTMGKYLTNFRTKNIFTNFKSRTKIRDFLFVFLNLFYYICPV